ncbi:MAG: hypothetical protein HQM02_05980 [Magnetococcales bacterium]|nr:hypothetical protein [Magnetococcales bacterium]
MHFLRVLPQSSLLFLALALPGFALMLWCAEAGALEVAPRISDREIIQELASIKAGQDKQNQRFEDINKRFEDINKRFEDVNKRIDDLNKRIDDLSLSLNNKIEAYNQSLNKRIDDLNQSLNARIDDLHKLILTLFSSLLGIMVAFIGFILWDRHTMTRPLDDRITQNAEEIKNNQEFLQERSNLLNQLLLALRELAKDDPKLSTVLRNFSLL